MELEVMELERDEELSIHDLDTRELEKLLELDLENEEFEISLDSDKRDELVELKAQLDVKREEYYDFYESTVKDVMQEFINDQNLDGLISFEARLKRDSSVKISLDRKDIELEDLKDYLGVRFITQNRESAYTVAGLFMMHYCIPRGKEEEMRDDAKRFNAYQTRDYFKRPKVNEKGEVQYKGIHIFLEKDDKKFEMQIHDLDSYKNANLTHQEYKLRKCTERITEEIDFGNLPNVVNL